MLLSIYSKKFATLKITILVNCQVKLDKKLYGLKKYLDLCENVNYAEI